MSQIIIIRSSYTASQKKATYRWVDKNQEKVKEYQKNYHNMVRDRCKPFYELCNMYSALEHPEFYPKRKYTRRLFIA